jgi:hypothetical protein
LPGEWVAGDDLPPYPKLRREKGGPIEAKLPRYGQELLVEPQVEVTGRGGAQPVARWLGQQM